MANTDYDKYLQKTGKAPQNNAVLGGNVQGMTPPGAHMRPNPQGTNATYKPQNIGDALPGSYGDFRNKGYGIVPAGAKTLGEKVVNPVLQSGGNLLGAAGKAAKSASRELFATPEQNRPIGSTLNNGATIGNQFPEIDFSNTSINTQVLGGQAQQRPFGNDNPIELTQRGYFDRQDKANSGPSGTANTRYTLNEQGQPVRMDNATGQVGLVPNRITQNVLKPGEQPFRITRENTGTIGGGGGTGFDQINAAIDRGDISADQGLAMYRNLNATPEQRQAASQQAQFQNLMSTAIAPQDDGSFTGLGRAKRAQTGAIAGLNAIGSQIQNQGAQQTAQLRELGGMAKWQAEQAQKQEAAKQSQSNTDREYGLKQNEFALKQEQANNPQAKYTIDQNTGLPVQTQGRQADAMYKASTTQEFVNRFNDPEYKSLVEQAQENGMTQQDADRVWLNAVMKHYGMG